MNDNPLTHTSAWREIDPVSQWPSPLASPHGLFYWGTELLWWPVGPRIASRNQDRSKILVRVAVPGSVEPIHRCSRVLRYAAERRLLAQVRRSMRIRRKALLMSFCRASEAWLRSAALISITLSGDSEMMDVERRVLVSLK